jgi:hypothetical protein
MRWRREEYMDLMTLGHRGATQAVELFVLWSA